MSNESKKCGAESLYGHVCCERAGHDGSHRRRVNGGSEAVWTRDHRGYLHLCTHRNVEGQCDRCAADAERDRKAADYDRLAAEMERLTRERDGLRAALGWIPLSVREAIRLGDTAKAKAWVEKRTAFTRRVLDEKRAAEARAEALETSATAFLSWFNADGSPCDGPRFREEQAKLRAALAATPPAEPDWDACWACGRLGTGYTVTPPADLTQHPAYRAGVEAATTACVAEHANQVQAATRKGDRRHDRMLAEERALVAARLEDEIRALFDTKEVRDGEG